jgi:hypothetical protein
VELLADTTADGVARLRLAVHSTLGAEGVVVTLPTGADVMVRAVNGAEVAMAPGAGRVRTVVHWGGAADTLFLELAGSPALDELEVSVTEQHLRPWELVGRAPFIRPPGLVPNLNAFSDRALIRGTWRWPLRGRPDVPALPLSSGS